MCVAQVLFNVTFWCPRDARWSYYLLIQQEDWNLRKKGRNCNGALIGFKRNTKAHTELFTPWWKCAMEKQCITPKGSSRTNHRQDQVSALPCPYPCPSPLQRWG